MMPTSKAQNMLTVNAVPRAKTSERPGRVVERLFAECSPRQQA